MLLGVTDLPPDKRSFWGRIQIRPQTSARRGLRTGAVYSFAASLEVPASLGARREANSAAAFCSALFAAVCSVISTATLVSRSTVRIFPSARVWALISMRALQEIKFPRRKACALDGRTCEVVEL